MDISEEETSGIKTCNKCKLSKPLSGFAFLNRERKLNSRCRVCVRKANQAFALKNPESCAASQKRYHAKNIFAGMRRSMMKIKYSKGFPSPVSTGYLETLWGKQGGKCYWSGIDMFKGHGRDRNPKMVSPDRLDTSKGYVEGNIVLCCLWANLGRRSTPVDIWIEFMKELNLKGLWS